MISITRKTREAKMNKEIKSEELKEASKPIINLNTENFNRAKNYNIQLKRAKDSFKKEFLKGGKYFERYEIIKEKGSVIIETIKYLLKFKSWTWTQLAVLLNALYALYELAVFYSQDLEAKERNEFIVACIEYTVEVGFGKDLPDMVWDFLLSMLSKIIPLTLALHGVNLENKKTPILFQGVKVLDLEKERYEQSLMA